VGEDSAPRVRLELVLASFDERPFASTIQQCEERGVRFETMASLGDTASARRSLYELNRACSADIPGRGPFFTYEEYLADRIDHARYCAAGTMVALEGDAWIGMAGLSDWRSRGFMFNEMTGVRADRRGRGIALALKVLGIRFARTTGARRLYTFHDARNVAAIALNRRLGYVDSDFGDELFAR
jgi:RimJ/RimL family protein N-acetyltransferase